MKRLLILSLMALVLVAGCVGGDTGTNGTESGEGWFPDTGTGDTGTGDTGTGEEYTTVAINVLADSALIYHGSKVTIEGFFNPNARFNAALELEDSMVITGDYEREIWVETLPSGDYPSGNYEVSGTINAVEYCMCQQEGTEAWVDEKFNTRDWCEQRNQMTDTNYRCRPDSYKHIAFIDVDSLVEK